jgi:hypothetical protein
MDRRRGIQGLRGVKVRVMPGTSKVGRFSKVATGPPVVTLENRPTFEVPGITGYCK